MLRESLEIVANTLERILISGMALKVSDEMT